MSNKPPKTELEQLQQFWYKKLEDEGFEDIEQTDGKLKSWSSRFAHSRIQELREEKEPYYYMCNQFLNEYKFDSRFEQIIWEYHSNALSSREIAKIFDKAKVYKTNRQTVWLIIKRLEKAMKNMYISSSQHE